MVQEEEFEEETSQMAPDIFQWKIQIKTGLIS